MEAGDRRINPLPRATRIPGPTPAEFELEVAEIVEGACRLYDDRDLGPRTRRDRNGVGELRVDFTYDDTDPPVALEVTELTSPATRATGSELMKMEDRLAQAVHDDRLGQWTLAIEDGSDTREIEPLVEELMRNPSARSGVNHFFDGAPTPADEQLKVLLDRAFGAGLADALHVPSGDEDAPGLMILPPVVHGQAEAGFRDLLDQAIADNATKLGEARPRQTHLAVFVGRAVSSDPGKTPAPELPDAIDTLWVLLGYFNAKATYRTWRTVKGSRQWTLFHHPLGRPSTTSP